MCEDLGSRSRRAQQLTAQTAIRYWNQTNFVAEDNSHYDQSLDGFFSQSSEGKNCPICGRYISNRSNLRKHINRAHGTYSFTCPKCGKSYKVACDLRRHALSSHNIRLDNDFLNGNLVNSDIIYQNFDSDLISGTVNDDEDIVVIENAEMDNQDY